MIVVTGGAGFIGSNLVHELNRRGRDDIVVVDDLSDGRKFSNIATARIADYLDVEEFRRWFAADRDPYDNIERVYHLGACSTTTEWDGRMMLDLNYAYSRDLIRYCLKRTVPIVYAMSRMKSRSTSTDTPNVYWTVLPGTSWLRLEANSLA